MSCNDCHEIKLDAKTSATQAWLYGDYLMWKANEGIMPKNKLKERIVKIIGGKKQKKTLILATLLNNKPLATTLDYSLYLTQWCFTVFRRRAPLRSTT